MDAHPQIHPAPLSIADSVFQPGFSVIEASAGTGKTHAICHLVPRLLLDGTVGKLSEILLVTFTNDAAGELAERVRSVLNQLAAEPMEDESEKRKDIAALREKFLGDPARREILRRALLDIDTLQVSTIHSFCQRTLQAEGSLCGLPSMPELIPDSSSIVEETLFDLWREHLAGDAFVSAIVSVQGWKPQSDLSFIRSYLDIDEPLSLPTPDADKSLGFGERLQSIRIGLIRLRASGELEPLFEFFESIDGSAWNKSHADKAVRSRYYDILRDSAASNTTAVLEALGFLAEIGLEKKGGLHGAKKSAVQVRNRLGEFPCFDVIRSLASWIAPESEKLQWLWQHFCAGQVACRLRRVLKERRQITFSGLIDSLRDALDDDINGPLLQARLRSRYSVGLIDESQDTDARQFAIFEKIFLGSPAHRLIMIGDPKQSIYGFRGADLNTYLRAKDRHANQPGRIFRLDTTYRAPQGLVDCINALFSVERSFFNRKLVFTPARSARKDIVLIEEGGQDSSRAEAWIVSDDEREHFGTDPGRLGAIISRVARHVVGLLSTALIRDESAGPGDQRRKVRPNDIAVLVANHAQGEALAEEFRKFGVPVVISSDSDIMSSEEARELLTLLQAIAKPQSSGLRYAALGTRLLGMTVSALQRLRNDPAEDEAELNRFSDWLQLWESRGASAMLLAIERAKGPGMRLAGLAAGERRVTNYRQLCDLLQVAEHERQLKPEHLLRWFAQEIARVERKATAEERQLQLESDEHAVRIVTMHKAKGLEYNLVFCPFLWWGLTKQKMPFRTLRNATRDGRDALVSTGLNGADLATEARLAAAELEERLRVAYVAMTRAKVKLWFAAGAVWGDKKNTPVSALDWLLRKDPSKALADAEFLEWVQGGGCPESESEGRGTRHRLELEKLVERTGAPLSLRALPEPCEPAPYKPAPLSDFVCEALPAPALPEAWLITSFSKLTREKHAYDSGLPDLSVEPVKPSGEEAEEACNEFLSAPAGAQIGTLVHDFIQTWDLSEPSVEAVSEHIQRARFVPAKGTPAEFEARLLSLFRALPSATLPGLGCALREACPVVHASEWHFHLPIAGTLNGRSFAEAFSSHARPEHRHYAKSLEQLSDRDIGGFLQGFIDRLVRYGDHWGVIDWKTNLLGTSPRDYRDEALVACAMESHYFLQAHLYLVALRRYLRQRNRPFSLSGAWLVFLRAVQPGSARGLLHIEAPEALLDALDALFLK